MGICTKFKIEIQKKGIVIHNKLTHIPTNNIIKI